MYKTGDMAWRLPCRDIEFLGRYDQQVKISGHRVELGEIKNQLLSYEGITEALVTLQVGKTGQQILYAYYNSDCATSHEIEASALRNFLAARLPYYMVPAHFIRIESIPLTRNGKIDYEALPKWNNSIESENIDFPGKTEQLLIEIWQDILDVENVSLSSNFLELGGDSIKAVQVAFRLSEFGIYLKAKDILVFQTIGNISPYAVNQKAEPDYEQEIVRGETGLSPIKLWFFSQHLYNPHFYNQSLLLRLHKKVDVRIMERTFATIIRHHDGLRLNYNQQDQTLFYNNRHLEMPFVIPEIIAEHFPFYTFKASFDITSDLLIKAAILRRNDEDDSIFITAHHLIIDGVSWRILLEDLYTIYDALERGEHVQLPAKTASVLIWQKRLLEYEASGALKSEDIYWDDIESVEFTIPQDFETSNLTFDHILKVSGSLGKEWTDFLLKEAHRTYKTDVPILLNTALAITLKEWTGLNLFIIEQENHGRHLEDIDISRSLNWFTVMYPLKLQLEDDTIGNQIKEVKEQMRNVPSYGIGYGIRKYIGKRPNLRLNRLSEIRLNYLGQFNKELNNELFTYDWTDHGIEVDPDNAMSVKLELNLMVIEENLNVEIIYNAEAFKESTVSNFKNTFLENILIVLEHIRKEEEVHFTPSDFDAVDLDYGELNALFS